MTSLGKYSFPKTSIYKVVKVSANRRDLREEFEVQNGTEEALKEIGYPLQLHVYVYTEKFAIAKIWPAKHDPFWLARPILAIRLV